jgi:2-methylcitrate dehydratase PrpD
MTRKVFRKLQVENRRITRILAEFVVEATYDDLSDQVVKAAKMMILDTLGCGIAGYVLAKKDVAPIFRLIEELGGKEECTILVSGEKTSWFNAIMANGTLMHSIDYDNTRIGGMIHPGAVVVPSVLAICEKLGSSGRDAILATVLANEVISRIASSVMPTHYDFWHSTGTNGTFAGAIVAGKLLGLDSDQMEKAIGIAADQASGFSRCIKYGDFTKSFHAGSSSAKGVLSAMLVRHGATGPLGILEYPRGYCYAYSKAPSLEKIVCDLGQSFDIVNNYPKYYPSNLGTHCAIEATLKIVKVNNLSDGDIARVNVEIFTLAASILSNRNPETTLGARMSLPYCIAVSILDKELNMAQFKEGRLGDQRIQAIMDRIYIHANSEYDEHFPDMYTTKIEVITKSGNVFSIIDSYPKGFSENPISDEELENKFTSLCSYALHRTKINKIMEMIMQMEKIDNINGIISLCKGDDYILERLENEDGQEEIV